MTEARLLYVTAPDVAEARTLAHELLKRRLIACANILPQIESVYHWQDEIRTDSEVVLIVKTERRLVDAVTQAVVELHPYETPCVLALSVESGAKGYLAWLEAETAETIETAAKANDD